MEDRDYHTGSTASESGDQQIDAITCLMDYAYKEHYSQWCMIVAIDIENSFNTAEWSRIINIVKERDTKRYPIYKTRDSTRICPCRTYSMTSDSIWLYLERAGPLHTPMTYRFW
ncbi:hypothetical protein JTB14_009679 [Gonioctena quinquepunctata]|nr:hypothetical protein JTB14_009679 [Gonioctena quinquepunctata]